MPEEPGPLEGQPTEPRGFVVETWDLGPASSASESETGPPPGNLPVELPPPSLPGYRIEAELGQGAMGRVYRAHDAKRGRPCALKVGRSLLPEDVERFEIEVELQRQLHHPGVPRVLSSGRLADGRPYFTQTLVRGARTLGEAAPGADWVRRLEWVARVADALAVAHGRCVIHGDIKPDNLLIDQRGRSFVIDWGVSRLAACAAPAPAELSPDLVEVQRRQSEFVQGTLAYMPSEQLRGGLREASDVYALGVVLYELLSGVHPLGHTLDDADGAIQAILGGRLRPLPRERLPEGLPAEVPELIQRCLRLDPGQRPTSVELARVLRRLLRNQRRTRAQTRAGSG